MRFNNRITASTFRNKLLYVCGQKHDNLFQTCSDHRATNLSSLTTGEVHVSVDYLLFSKRNLLYSLNRKKAFTRLRKREKLERSHTLLVYENTTIYLTHEPSCKAVKVLVRALVKMRSKDAQCKTKELP